MKSTKHKAPHGASTQTVCSGKELCNKGACSHPLPWWHTANGGVSKFEKGKGKR